VVALGDDHYKLCDIQVNHLHTRFEKDRVKNKNVKLCRSNISSNLFKNI